MATPPVLEAHDLRRYYPVAQGLFRPAVDLKALDGVSFSLGQGETLAVVGESGSGKSTLARQLTLIETPSSGRLDILGKPADAGDRRQVRSLRRHVQMVFQNPYGSLNPRRTIGAALEEPLLVNTAATAAQRRAAVAEMLGRVGLRPEHAQRYPHMFSGGQRQRIAIARALMLEPEILVADEPVSALDVSIRAQVLNLLLDLQDAMHLAMVFISHDLSVVRFVADEVLVLYLGRTMEQAAVEDLFERPAHPYTRALLAATPTVAAATEPGTIFQPIRGEIPSPLAPPSGCVFRTRCPHAIARCADEVPALRALERRRVACHRAEEILALSA